MIQLIATDLDGTLLNPGGLTMTERNKKALELAVSRGVHVVVCTGRLHTGGLPFALTVPGDVPVVSSNGAVVRLSRSGTYLRRRPMAPELVRELLPMLRQAGMSPWFYIGDACWTENHDEGIEALVKRTGSHIEVVADLSRKIPDGPEKILGILPAEDTARLQDRLEKHFAGRLYVTRSMPTQIEVLAADATKGQALAFVAERYGVPKERIAAFGDNFNDLELFKAAGLKVAMGNAEEPLKAAADIVTDTNDRSGVAQVIEKLLAE